MTPTTPKIEGESSLARLRSRVSWASKKGLSVDTTVGNKSADGAITPPDSRTTSPNTDNDVSVGPTDTASPANPANKRAGTITPPISPTTKEFIPPTALDEQKSETPTFRRRVERQISEIVEGSDDGGRRRRSSIEKNFHEVHESEVDDNHVEVAEVEVEAKAEGFIRSLWKGKGKGKGKGKEKEKKESVGRSSFPEASRAEGSSSGSSSSGPPEFNTEIFSPSKSQSAQTTSVKGKGKGKEVSRTESESAIAPSITRKTKTKEENTNTGTSKEDKKETKRRWTFAFLPRRKSKTPVLEAQEVESVSERLEREKERRMAERREMYPEAVCDDLKEEFRAQGDMFSDMLGSIVETKANLDAEKARRRERMMSARGPGV